MNLYKDVFGSSDEMRDANGDDLAVELFAQLKDLNVSNINGPFLGLGAGYALAERGLAKRLNIPEENITLVDQEREDLDEFGGQYTEADMFEYLANEKRKYAIVTVIGFEDLLNMRNNAARLWNGLDKVTGMGSIVVIYPSENKFQVDESKFQILQNVDKFFIAKRIS